MHALAKIISAGNDESKLKWADALFATRNTPNHHAKENSRANNLGKETPAVVNTKSKTGKPPRRKMILTLYVVAATITAYIIHSAAWPKSPSVKNIMFCDEQRFSKVDKMCRDNIKIFPSDTKMIYTSFEISNMPVGEPFDRRWYRNGRWFKTKSGHFDTAWEGYTFIYNPNTHDPGDYVMRIIVNNKSTTGSFTVLD